MDGVRDVPTAGAGLDYQLEPFGPPLPLEFYSRPADVVATELLGKLLVMRAGPGAATAGRIVETEAYLGEDDLACHAAKGLTKRTSTLYGPPGTAYVYLVYGIHELFNVVVARMGEPQAVLVRALEPWPPSQPPGQGTAKPLATLERSRRIRAGAANPSPMNGPGKLTLALGIDRRHDGLSLLAPPLTIHPGPAPARVARSARVGVAYAGAWAEAVLRYYDAESGHVSRPPRSVVGLGNAGRID